jgi:hypothetical protein
VAEPKSGPLPETATALEPRPSVTLEVVRETRLERTVEELVLPAAPAGQTVAIEPAPPPQAPLPAPPAADHPERPISVRIGTIEIDAGQPGTAPPAPVAPAPQPPQAAEGFADFAHLRNYTPWQW